MRTSLPLDLGTTMMTSLPAPAKVPGRLRVTWATLARVLVLALDFDGVICDGSREVFVVSLAAYLDLVPDSRLAGPGRQLLETALSGGDVAAEPLFTAHEALTPLGNRAEDFGAALRAIELERVITDQGAYDAFFAEQDPAWLQAYHRAFYRTRERVRSQDLGRWLALQPPYQPMVDLVARHAQSCVIAIATAKDGRSVRLLLDAYGLGQLIPKDRLLDKETGTQKTAHLLELACRLHIPPEQMTFVDDKVNHLDRVAPLGVRCVLAGWGFNSEREHDLARQHGHEVATLATVENLLFGDHLEP